MAADERDCFTVIVETLIVLFMAIAVGILAGNLMAYIILVPPEVLP